MLPRHKIDELVEQMTDNFYNTGDLPADKIEAIIRDQCEDALDDAYGCGEYDAIQEAKRAVPERPRLVGTWDNEPGSLPGVATPPPER